MSAVRNALLSLLSASITVACPGLARAEWPVDGVPVCTANNNQVLPAITSDGRGGAIVTWTDSRDDNDDIYAMHVLVSGEPDPAWPPDGRAVCTNPSLQQGPRIVSDGAGGAIITWFDNRSETNLDIYAQHVRANGLVDPAWPVNGRALCTNSGYQDSPAIVSDGAGGAIVAWTDARSGSDDIYAQHVLATGIVDPVWPVDGRAICVAGGNQYAPAVVADGLGGAIITWQDVRSGPGTTDVYAQHVSSLSTVDLAWPQNGVAVCTAANLQRSPVIVSDGAHGAIISWHDNRTGGNDIYVQHVRSTGAVDSAWPADGRALCTAAGDQLFPQIVTDGAGGAIVTWEDSRDAATMTDIYAQHVLSTGVVDGEWPAGGRALCNAPKSQFAPSAVADGDGGAIVTWTDQRNGASDIYSQHVLSSGVAGPGNGRALCLAANDQDHSVVVTDGSGSAIATWNDSRNGNDIYAQKVSPAVPGASAVGMIALTVLLLLAGGVSIQRSRRASS